jgi:anti-sigma factor RsiW
MSEECRKYFDRISEYLDGELEQDICHEIDAHLRECPECRRCVESLKKTVELCREGAREEIPQDAKERLKSALRECIERRSR